ncbi:MAG: FAD-dependent oxidoreductase, partial [Planctomycetes bacterium]|nr:FAD-dependent oxidoreductase [Planctomycetota bacterium]
MLLMESPPGVSTGQRVVVLGGGVVGLAAARELAGRGLDVSVIEARRVGEGASSASVGVLSAP